MIIVISCSGSKNSALPEFGNQKIVFCARPNLAPMDENRYVHPDDHIDVDGQKTWREWVEAKQEYDIFLQAYRLYKPSIYRNLYRKYGQKLFIFSAGWGIVRANFKLPKYDITFSQGQNIADYKRRLSSASNFNDYNHLDEIDGREEILFVGGSKYILPFCLLTSHLPTKKIIVYKSRLSSQLNLYLEREDFEFQEYLEIDKPFTNWHYTYANKELLDRYE